MPFDLDSHVVQLCAKGMELGGPEGAALFLLAWEQADTHVEKAIAAHYVARHQDTIAAKLSWDETALQHALQSGDENIRDFYPSLYLNIAKCHEDLGAAETALLHYQLALQHAERLPDDGYSNLIRNGISNGIERLKE